MKIKKILIFLSFTVLISRMAGAQTWEKGKYNFWKDWQILKYITRVTVLVEGLSEDAVKIGLTEHRIQTVTELRLRKEGINIVTREEVSKEDVVFGSITYMRIPTLYVNVHVAGAAVSVRLEILDFVKLDRIAEVWCLATTWHSPQMAGTHGNNPESIVGSVNQLLDEFFNDYYKANPKKDVI